MKWCRTILVVNNGGAAESEDWRTLHDSYTRAIKSIDHPAGTKSLTLRKKYREQKSGAEKRNGVKYLRERFLQHMTNDEHWTAEAQGEIEIAQMPAVLKSYPDMQSHTEEVQSMFGGFDFLTRTKGGFRAAIEWETGNVSSSHRSLNKLVIALNASVINAGVLILPSRDLYEHLTDRVGNIQEVSPYLCLWQPD